MRFPTACRSNECPFTQSCDEGIRDDLSIALDNDRTWRATCEICGGNFAHKTWDGDIIAPLESHEHLETPNLLNILAISRAPGANSDRILRAAGIL